jgi:hypothetical protein
MIIPYDIYSSDHLLYDHETYQSAPAPSLNGGLYTGEPFDQTCTYKNYPNKPDSVYLHTHTLSSANPPPGAQDQFPDSIRPGNNLPETKMMNIVKYDDLHSIVCSKNKETYVHQDKACFRK